VSLSDTPDPIHAPGTDLRRRARVVLAAFVATDVLLALGIWGNGIGLPQSVRTILLLCGMIGALAVIVIGLEPFRRWELRFAEKAEPEVVQGWQVTLFVLGPVLACIPVWHFLTGEPWRASIARTVGLAVYFAFFYALGRLQRRGVAPYWRPAWYGFFLAGITAGLIWSVVAGAEVTEGLATGISGPLVHYAYVRWAMRHAGDTKAADRRTS
jgi:hypothetical protein